MDAWVELLQEFGVNITMIGAMAFFIYKLWQQSKEREDKLMEVNAQAIDTLAKYADRLTVIEQDLQVIKDDVNAMMNRED
jgi:hypothetical protein